MEPRVTYPDLQIHHGVRNAVLVDMLSRVSFAEIGKKKYPSGAILHLDASKNKPLLPVTYNGKYLVVKNV